MKHIDQCYYKVTNYITLTNSRNKTYMFFLIYCSFNTFFKIFISLYHVLELLECEFYKETFIYKNRYINQ